MTNKKKPKDRSLKILFIGLVLIAIVFTLNNLVPKIYLNSGREAYLAKDYKKAYQDLRIAIKLNHTDSEARYYYVQTLTKFMPTLEIQKEIYWISQGNFADSADLVAHKQLDKWKSQILYNIGTNYIEKVPFSDKILRWDATKFPLTVSIENDSSNQVPEYYKSAIENAFLQWQSTTGNFIKFKFVTDSKDAQISVKIVPMQKNKNCKDEGECQYVAAYTEPGLKGNLLAKMVITVYDTNSYNEFFSQKQIYNTVLHEIGHSLGIMGHSDSQDDLMYMQSNSSQGNADQFRSDFQMISAADINTLNLLYKLIPDITNTPMGEYDSKNQIFAPIVMGSSEQINSKKLTEAQNYINSAPNIPNGYIDLASAYSEQKDYDKAVSALNRALELSSSDNDKFVVYFNLAIIYMNTQDWDNSLKYAQMAKEIKDSSDVENLIESINYNRGNSEFAKQAYLLALSKNPKSINDALNLADLYLKEFDFAAAGRTLNKLVQANPSAKLNAKVKSHWLLMMFFK